ncbi:MAG: DUF2950 domain-containing protein [Burkholderiales bacterium]
MTIRNTHRTVRQVARVLTMVVFSALVVSAAGAAAPAQKSFATPEDAVNALVQAAQAHDRSATLAVLGDASEWISSGDAIADKAKVDGFLSDYAAKHAIARDGDKATLTIGNDDFPFAFPLVKSGDQWRFDTATGKEELLARRIGANELSAMKVLQAIVDAEQDYAAADPLGDGLPAYAQRFMSRPGKRDGLYWPTKAGEPQSPLGVLVTQAVDEGYKQGEKQGGKTPTPYHGYLYRMLKGQGKNAESGAFDYVVHGRGIAGFAVIAYPARYANSGIMTFIVNQDGKIYQADLGPGTKTKAEGMQRYDPGKGWTVVEPK